MKRSSITLRGLIPLLIAAALPATASAASAGSCNTTVPGGLVAAGTTWTRSASPICVMGDIQVSLLTIEAGVRVEFQGNYSMNVLTKITVNGERTDPVVFTSPSGTRWKGIRFLNTGPGSSFTGAIFENTDSSAVYIQDAGSPSFNECIFRNNRRTSGRGAALNAIGAVGDLVLSNCEFSSNTSSDHGGALRIKMTTGSLFCTDSLFQSNTSNPGYNTGNFVGGALWLEAGGATIRGCEFRGNRANARCVGTFGCNVTARGGAVYFGGSGSSTVENTTFISNRTDARNSGNCFFGGSSASYGAGAYIAGGTVGFTNCVFTCNSTVWTSCNPTDAHGGGGLYVKGGIVTVDQCTIARNNNATGLHRAGGTLTVTNSIVYWNNASGNQVGGTAAISYSDVQGGDFMNNNITFAPAFAGMGCDRTNYSLVRGSPCIDAADPSSPGDVCFPPSWGSAVPDMGADGGPKACNWASGLTTTPVSPAMLSVSAGGTQTFNIDAGPDYGNNIYVLLGSATGFAPGFNYRGGYFPLELDNYFNTVIGDPAKAKLMASVGVLDATGKPVGVSPTFTVPAGFNRLVGLQLYYAYVVVAPGDLTLPLFVSNPVAAELAP